MVRIVRVEIAAGAVKSVAWLEDTVTVMVEKGSVLIDETGVRLTAASTTIGGGPVRLRNDGSGLAVVIAAIADSFVAICDRENAQLCDPTTAQKAEIAAGDHEVESPPCVGRVRVQRIKGG